MPLKPGSTHVCIIDSAAFEGKSVARIGGFVVFVEGAVPGDEVRIRIVRKKKNHGEAVVEEVLSPSPLRTDPRCEHFGTCGGCKWQHVAYEEQLRFKARHVQDSFERIGGLTGFEMRPIQGCASPFFYRNKMEYSFSTREWLDHRPRDGETDEGIFLGLHVPRRYDKVLDINACHLQSDLSNSILLFTRVFARTSGLPVYSSERHAGYWRFLVIRQSKRTNECMANVVTFEDRPDVMKRYAEELAAAVPGVTTVVNTINEERAQIAFGKTRKVYAGSGTISERLGDLRFTISPESFFQTNTEQAERLYQVALEYAGLTGKETVYDLYCGTGTIALFMAGKARSVLGIEAVGQSVQDAEQNAKGNGITNCDFMVGDLRDALSAHLHESRHPEVVIVDPPRSGMHDNAIKDLAAVGPERIVYISCNPATQARDCKMFASLGYITRSMRPVDMFPHTYHIENVALLEKNS